MDRDAYVEKTKAKLDEWNSQIDKLQAQAKAAETENKANYEKQLAKPLIVRSAYRNPENIRSECRHALFSCLA